LIEVNYQSGLPETYQLAVTFATDQQASKLAHNCPQAVIAHIIAGEDKGLLCDALYIGEAQQRLFGNMADNKAIPLPDSTMHFSGTTPVHEYLHHSPEIKSKIHKSTEANTSINYDNRFLLKMYRKVDQGLHPDLEITRFLSEQVKFEHVPAYTGSVAWENERGSILLGLMQVMVENHGDGYSYFLERLHNYKERILARDRSTLHPEERIGTLTRPEGYETLPEALQVLLGGPAAEQSRLLGIRTGQLHLALASDSGHPDFAPEDFSLHYQRSLYSSMQSLVREASQGVQRNLSQLSPAIVEAATQLLENKERLLDILKRIYSKKLDVTKIRIHGNYHLGQVLLTGKDLAIKDFGGDPYRTLSERRLKRSPLRDVVAMIASFHYTAYEGLRDTPELLPFAGFWAYHQSGFFVKAYLETVHEASFIPVNKQDLQMMLQTYLLQRALHNLADDMNSRPEWAIVPLGIIKTVLNEQV
jgi:maltose alpha-D-glucosyltransferase/alpha-amylase